MSTEIEALEQFFAAVNRNDMQAITRHFDPQILRIETSGLSNGWHLPWHRGRARARRKWARASGAQVPVSSSAAFALRMPRGQRRSTRIRLPSEAAGGA